MRYRLYLGQFQCLLIQITVGSMSKPLPSSDAEVSRNNPTLVSAQSTEQSSPPQTAPEEVKSIGNLSAAQSKQLLNGDQSLLGGGKKQNSPKKGASQGVKNINPKVVVGV